MRAIRAVCEYNYDQLLEFSVLIAKHQNTKNLLWQQDLQCLLAFPW